MRLMLTRRCERAGAGPRRAAGARAPLRRLRCAAACSRVLLRCSRAQILDPGLLRRFIFSKAAGAAGASSRRGEPAGDAVSMAVSGAVPWRPRDLKYAKNQARCFGASKHARTRAGG